MAFYGCEFTFDGHSCKEFGLMIYDFGGQSQGDVDFPSTGSISEDRINGRYDSLLYGVTRNQALTFTLVFGANVESLDEMDHLDRYDVARISSWLTDRDRWGWLQIVQDDMHYFRYRCLISQLRLVTYGSFPWAFTCQVTCDSPFGYTVPRKFDFEISETTNIVFQNDSSYNGYYRPKLLIRLDSGAALSIVNRSDNNREFRLENVPTSAKLIEVDNQNMILTDKSGGINLYPYFNKHFLRLVRGTNRLIISPGPLDSDEESDGTVKAAVRFECEFPVNIGG